MAPRQHQKIQDEEPDDNWKNGKGLSEKSLKTSNEVVRRLEET